MSLEEPQRPDVTRSDEEQVDGPFSFDVDIEPTDPGEIGKVKDRAPEEIPVDPAEPPRYWPDDLFEPVEHDMPETTAEPRADRALPPASELPAPTGAPVDFEPPAAESRVDVAAQIELPVEPDIADEPAPVEYLEPVDPIVHGLPPVPDLAPPAVAPDVAQGLPKATASGRLALPEARIPAGEGQAPEKPREPLLRQFGEFASSPLRLVDRAQGRRVESRRRREASKTVEQREKERKKREERRARRRKKEERKRRREAEKKRRADARRTAKLRKDETSRVEALAGEKGKADEGTPKKVFGIELAVPKLPFIGRRLAARAEEAAAEEDRKEASTLEKEDFSDRFVAGLRRRAYRFRSTLQRNVIGLDIGASNLRAVRIKDGVPVEIHSHPIPEGIIVNGLLEEPDELVEELKRFWKLAGLRSKKVNFSLSNRMVTMRTKRLPAKQASDIPQAVAMNAEELIYPMDPKQSVMDYAEMSRSGPMSDLQITAADEEMAKGYARAVEKAGLVSVSCELGPLAAARAVVIPRSPTRSHALINVGAEVTWMTVGSGPDVFFLRIIDIGGDDFTRAIVEELGIDFLEAEGLKKRCGLGSSPIDATLDAETFARCREALRRISDHLCQELAQTKRYWDEARPERVISSWGLMGGGGRLAGLKEQIAVFAGLQGPEALVAFPGFEGAENLDLNATVIGLARGNTMSLLPDPSMKDSNVAIPGLRRRSKISLSRSRREGKKLASGRRGQHASARTLAILGCVVVLGGGYFMKMKTSPQIDAQKTELESLQSAQESQAKSKTQASSGNDDAPHYVNSPSATKVAAMLPGVSIGTTIQSVNTSLALVGATDISIHVNDSTITVEGTVSASSGVTQLIKLLAADPAVGEVSVKAQSPIPGGTSFTIEMVSGS